MKYAVSLYGFNQYIKKGLLTLVQCVEKAKEMGFDAIEIVDFMLGDDPVATAKELREAADKSGIEISNLVVGGDLLKANGVEKAKEMVKIAEILGVSFMRHDVAFGPKDSFSGFDGALDELADACREITVYAETKGIRTMTENHGFFSQDSRRIEKLVNRVAHPNFGHLIDIGNFLCADEDPAVAVGRNAGYCFYAHIKDFIVKNGNCINPGEGFFTSRGGNYLKGTIIGHGDVPVLQCLKILKKAGFDGWLAIEFEGMEDCIEGIRIGFDNLKRFVDSI